MLIGIAAKNGVLIVEFINQLRDAGESFEDAIVEASGIRLRPVIMTTIATVMGSIPLILATGAGAESRTVLGIVVISGVTLATFLTLFVVPSFYALLARRTGSPQAVARMLARLTGGASGSGPHARRGALARISHQAACRRQKLLGFTELTAMSTIVPIADCAPLRQPEDRSRRPCR